VPRRCWWGSSPSCSHSCHKFNTLEVFEDSDDENEGGNTGRRDVVSREKYDAVMRELDQSDKGRRSEEKKQMVKIMRELKEERSKAQ